MTEVEDLKPLADIVAKVIDSLDPKKIICRLRERLTEQEFLHLIEETATKPETV